MPTAPSEHEALAANVVTAVVGGRAVFLDDGSLAACVDYQVSPTQGSPFALEVSRLTDEDALRIAGALAAPWPVPGLKHSWHLYLDRDARVGEVKCNAGSALLGFEAAGGRLYSATVTGDEADPAVTTGVRADMERLRIRLAHIRDVPGPPMVTASKGWGGSGPAPAVAANREVEQQARSNAAKLAGSGYAEAHLFLWADGLSLGSSAFLPTEFPRGSGLGSVLAPPQLPAGVHVVWAALWPGTVMTKAGQPIWPTSQPHGPISVVPNVWRVRPPADWELLGDVNVPTN